MSRLVMKFGGTSVGDVDRIARVARIVAAERKPGLGLAVVVSAMSGETDRLVGLARGAAGEGGNGVPMAATDFNDEYDVIVSTGEQVTTGLLALALRRIGIPARSWQNWQIPFRTDTAHSKARVADIPEEMIGKSMDDGVVAIVPGFQGVTDDNRITTLGRGGSDTSAVALAAALNAVRCDIYTDVDGVYTTDPRVVSKAQRIEKISYEEMLELASAGAKELAFAKRVPVRVLSSFVEPGAPNPGTLVCPEDEIVEKQVVSGVAYSRDEAKVTMLGVEDHPGVAAEIFGKLADANINVDMIVQSEARQPERQNILFTCPDRDASRAVEALEQIKAKTGVEEVHIRRDVAKVSVIGIGMRSQVGVARAMFAALAQKG
ncbi:MAG: aspartate kinase, partial [Terricaulis sp.]